MTEYQKKLQVVDAIQVSERTSIDTGAISRVADPGDWLLFDGGALIDVMTDEAFKAEYEPKPQLQPGTFHYPPGVRSPVIQPDILHPPYKVWCSSGSFQTKCEA